MTTTTKKNKTAVKEEEYTKKLCALTKKQVNIISKRQREILLEEQRNVSWIEAARDIIEAYPELIKNAKK